MLLSMVRQDPGFLDEQHGAATADRRCTLQNRWHTELSFKRIKQHLRIKRFLGTSDNARHKPSLECSCALRSDRDPP